MEPAAIQVVRRTTILAILVVRRKIHLSRANGQVEFRTLRVYPCRSKGFSLLTRLPSEAFSTHVIHHAALPMQPQRRHFCIEMALQLHLIIFNRQVCYSA